MERDFEVRDGKGRKSNQRMKHFLVLQYLLEHTDVNNPAKTKEIEDHLKEDCGIYTERRSIYKDIEEINIAYVMQELNCSYEEAVEELAADEDLATIRYKHKSGFYVARRPLDLEDARLIAECVHTARFVTAKNAENIVEDIGSLFSEHQRDKLQHDTFSVARVKSNNKELFAIVDLIHEAMEQVKDGRVHIPEKIRFQYLKCAIQNVSQSIERRKGEYYVVSPHAIMINESNYYLLGIDDKNKRLRTYRIDRMQKVKLTGEPRKNNEQTDNLKEYLETYPQRVFSMYGGRCETVRIQFINDLLDTVHDRFGEYASYFKVDAKHFAVSVTVEISPMFFGWLCGFGKKAKLLSPDPVIEEFTQHLAKMQELYK